MTIFAHNLSLPPEFRISHLNDSSNDILFLKSEISRLLLALNFGQIDLKRELDTIHFGHNIKFETLIDGDNFVC